MKAYRHLDMITGLFVALLLISNVASTKIVELGPFTFDGGTLLFPLTYIFGDILTEVYGYGRNRRVVWTGFLAIFLMAVLFSVVAILPYPADWTNQAAYDSILGQTPRIVLASCLAFLAGSFLNSYILAKMKIWSTGKRLWMRTIGSTLAGEGADTAIFCLVAFHGAMPNDLLFSIIVSNYVFKVLVEVGCTPLTYAVVGWLKRAENEDHYDQGTDFSPFALR